MNSIYIFVCVPKVRIQIRSLHIDGANETGIS